MANGITQWVCAVDGGGTGCRAAIADRNGNIRARASGGPANFTTDPVQAVASVRAAVYQAAQNMKVEADMTRLVTHVGIAGIMSPQDARDMAANLPFDVCTVSDDRLPSVLGGLGTRNGAVLAIGTGSFVAVRHSGTIRYWGGWGFSVGDQASGAWLGRAVLEHSLLTADGLAPESDLTRTVHDRFDDEPANISSFAAEATPSAFAEFAPLVVHAALRDDAVGQIIMARGADYLNTVLTAASLSDHDVICLTGGLGPQYEHFLDTHHRARLAPVAGVALDGALQLARQKLIELEKQA